MALVERDREHGAIAAVLVRGGTLVIEGGAGIGKTALLEDAAARARAENREVLLARGSELEAGFAFGIVRQLFERRLVAAGRAERDEVLAGPATIAGRLLLSDSGDGATIDASFAMLHGLYWMTANLAERRPLVLVVDDVHFADLPSLRWLAHVAARADGLDLALLVAVRSFEPGADAAAMAQLRAPATIARPALLSTEAVAGIVRTALGDDVADDVTDSLCRASGGNPFYVAELLRGASTDTATPPTPTVAGPEGAEAIQRHVQARLLRLDADARSLARALAVLGEDWPLRYGARIAGLDTARAEAVADDLVRLEVLAVAEQPRFLHPIIRDAIDGSLRRHERAAAHRLAARVLADEDAPAGRVAAHLVRCPPIGDAWVTERLRAAARSAVEAGAPREAAELLRRALGEPPAAELRVDVLRELARAEVSSGLGSACDRLSEALALTVDRGARGELVLELATTYSGLFRWVDAVDVIESYVDDPGGVDPVLAGRLEATMVVAGMHDARRAGRVGPLLGRLGAGQGEGLAGEGHAIAAGMALVLQGRPAQEAAAVLEWGLAEGNLPVDDWDARAARLWALVTVERFGVVETALARLREEVEHTGSARGLVAVFSTLGLVHLRLGALPEAEAAAQVALRVLREGDFAPGLPFGATVLADVWIEAGQLDEADRLLDELPTPPLVPGVGTVLIPAARGRLRLAQGRPEEALGQFEQCAWMFTAEAWGMEVRDVGYVHARSGAALAALQLGRATEALALAEAELADVRTFGGQRALGVALRAAGLVVGGRRGAELLTESVDCLRRSPAVLERAKSLVELGAVLRRAGRRTEARAPLAEGLDLAARAAARPLAERARRELVAAGARPRREVRFGVEALTPSERRVAELAAAGRTNRQIAQELYVTLKTVEGHLAQTYAKLGISGRGQLAAALDGGKVPGGHPVVEGAGPG